MDGGKWNVDKKPSLRQMHALGDHFKKCGIRNPFYVEENSFKLKSFNGKQREKFFDNLDLIKDFPELKQCEEKHKLFQLFYATYLGIRDNILDADMIKEYTVKVMDLNCKLYGSHMTIYMHCFVSHLPEFREIHGDFNIFNQQGLEKLNDYTTSQYFSSTNKHINDNKNDDYRVQIMNLRNRLELTLNDFQ